MKKEPEKIITQPKSSNKSNWYFFLLVTYSDSPYVITFSSWKLKNAAKGKSDKDSEKETEKKFYKSGKIFFPEARVCSTQKSTKILPRTSEYA